MAAIDELIETVRRLRAPGGCPWDQEQTHRSLSEHLISEASELLETIDKGDLPHMREELGDVLCQVVMHAQMASEEGQFTFEEVAREINEKLVRRHPHVFGDEQGQLDDSGAVLKRWEEIKAEEKRSKGQAPESPKELKKLPPRLPALLFARDTYKQFKKKNLPEPEAATEYIGTDLVDEELLGRHLFQLCVWAQQAKIDPEAALRRYTDRVVREAEAAAEDEDS